MAEVKQGTLRVFGDWFGKPYDNWHVPVSTHADGDELVIVFHEDEELRVRDPAGWRFTSEVFCIRHASCVTWRWCSYGRPKTAENWLTIEHRLGPDDRVRVRSDAPLGRSSARPSTTFPAVELLSY